METSARVLMEAVERSLRFECSGAAVTPIGPGHTTGWRTLPGCTTAHLLDVELVLDRPFAPPERLRSGECLCLPPDELHRCSVVAGEGLSRWSLFSCWILGSIDLMSLFALPPVLRGSAAQRVGDLNAEIAEARRVWHRPVQAAVTLQALAMRLVDALIRDAPLLPQSQALLMHTERLAPVLDHVERRLSSPLSRATLARVAGLSPSRFHALFREAMGIAPIDYVLRRRLQRAQQLLIATDLGIAVVAARVGFVDAFHFSRLFKRRWGAPPTTYRAMARRGLGGG